MFNKNKNTFILVLSFILPLAALQADSLTMGLNQTYTLSSVAPAASTPPAWITAVFTQAAASNQVTLNLSATNLSGGVNGEFITQWDFNFNPLTPNLEIVYNSGVNPTSVLIGEDGPQAPGDGKFDFEFNFDQAAGSRFTNGLSSSYTITNKDVGGTLAASDFNFLSTQVGGSAGPLLTAAHIQNTAPGKSAQITVGVAAPEPTTYISLASLLALVAGFATRSERVRRTTIIRN